MHVSVFFFLPGVSLDQVGKVLIWRRIPTHSCRPTCAGGRFLDPFGGCFWLSFLGWDPLDGFVFSRVFYMVLQDFLEFPSGFLALVWFSENCFFLAVLLKPFPG